MRHPATILISILATTCVVLGLQTPQATEKIAGTVLRTDTRAPLPDVRLELVREDYERIGTSYGKPCKPDAQNDAAVERRFATTDKNGKFTFTEIIPGTYYLYAEREGFLKYAYGQLGQFPIPAVMSIGVPPDMEKMFANASRTPPPPRDRTGDLANQQRRQAAPTTRIDNANPTDVPFQQMELSLTPAPTITGKILSEPGASLAAAAVQLYQFRYTPLNGRTLKSVRAALTDDDGKYRLFWLNPGRYFVSAGYSDYVLQPWTSGLNLTPNLPGADAGNPVTFYPSATAASNAVYVPLNPGTQPLIDLRLRSRKRLTTLFRLTGPSIPANAALVVTPAGGDLCAAADYGISPKKDDTFEVRDIPEGLYVATVMSGRDSISDLFTFKIEDGGPKEHVIPVVAPTTVWGTVFLEGTPLNVDLSGVRINLTRKGQELRQFSTATPDLKTGRFEIKGVGPGSYFATLDLPPGFYVQTIVPAKHDQLVPEQCGSRTEAPPSVGYVYLDLHGHLDAERPLTVPGIIPVAAECLVVTVRRNRPRYGYVYDRLGRPLSGALVVAVPQAVWFKSPDGGVAPPDHLAMATTDTDGYFEIKGASDVYQLFAFESIDPNDVWDPAIAERFHDHEGFEARRYELEMSRWVLKQTAYVDAAPDETCNQDNRVIRKLCILTAIPTTESAEIK